MSQGSALNTWKKKVAIDHDGKDYGGSKFLVEISTSVLNIMNGCWEMLDTQVWKTKKNVH